MNDFFILHQSIIQFFSHDFYFYPTITKNSYSYRCWARQKIVKVEENWKFVVNTNKKPEHIEFGWPILLKAETTKI